MQKIEAAERQPKEELDEEKLVNEVRPLIEDGGKLLSETNGIIRSLDPDGRLASNAKQKASTREASPEEYHLADVLKELTGSVNQTIEGAKSKLEGMPKAKKKLNPLWGLLASPLGQILGAVGLLLAGVLGLVGKLVSWRPSWNLAVYLQGVSSAGSGSADSPTDSPTPSVSRVFSGSLALAGILVAVVVVAEEVCSRASD